MPDANSYETRFSRYLRQWRQLNRDARLYLLHTALLTASLAIYGLFFNLAIEALGYPRAFLGDLNGLSIAVAALLSVPLWWLVTRIGLKRALIASAILQALSALIIAVLPQTGPLLLGVGLTGMAATVFQVSSPPFMMEQSDAATRDHLFSANTAINIGVAGVASLLAGGLPALFSGWLGVGVESATAYRATFAVAGMGLALSIVPLLWIEDRRSKNGDQQARAEKTAQPSQPTQPSATSDDLQRYNMALAETPAARAAWIERLPGVTVLLTRLPDPLPDLIRRPAQVIPLLISPLLISFGAALLIQYLNLFFKDRFAINDVVLGAIFAALGITTGLAALLGPLLSTRIGKIRTIVITQLLSIPFLIVLGFVPILGIAVGAALVRGALFNMGSPLYDAFAMERTAERARPIVIGVINGAYTVGYLVAPLISTRVQERVGFSPLFLATAAFYALAAVANYWLFIHKAAPARHSPPERAAGEWL